MTPRQLPWFAAFIALMALDTLITAWGVLCRPDFMEANPLFSHFMGGSPWWFIGVIVVAKSIAIFGIYLLIGYLNRKNDVWIRWNTGDVVAKLTTSTMAVALGSLAAINLFLV